MEEMQNRNKILRNNILLSGVFKAISLCTSFLIVPVTLAYLDNEPYGIWMTISSMAFWIYTFDIGLGNGMRNSLTAAISSKNYDAAHTYISSTFAMLTAIALFIGIIVAPLVLMLDFNQILNTSTISNHHLQLVILVALMLTLANFVVKNIGFIYISMQKYAINDFLTAVSSVVALLAIYLLTKTTESNLLYVVTSFMAIPVLIFLLGGIPIFVKYSYLRPSVKGINLNFNKSVIKKGLGFFLIQITSCLIIFGSSNAFISHFHGPESVTTYNIAYKYFNLLVIGYTIVIAPMWNAYTDAYVKGERLWIRKTFNRALMIWGGSVLVGFLMLLLCNLFYSFWVGESVFVPFSVSAATFAFIVFFNLNNCVTYLLNGLNIIYVQICTSVIATAVYLTTIAVYGKGWGIEGIVLSMTFCYAAMSMIHLYQCKLIIRQEAKGIWKK